jgi:hypothetical protein
MVYLFSFALLIMTSFAKAGTVGFASGANFTSTSIEGQVTVTCDGFNGTGSAIYNCRDNILEPLAYDYFVGPQDKSVNEVELKATHADGNSVTKDSVYDGVKGKSHDAFNLWISTIFQKPLLAVGINKIHYRTLHSVDSVEALSEGDFTVTVDRGPTRKCQTTQYNSTDNNDCSSQYSVCQRYFEQFNYCR